MGLPILFAVIAAALAAAALGLRLAPTLLAAYLLLAGQAGLVTWALSPFDAVTPRGLTIVEAGLLAAAGTAWWLAGRPRPDLAAARTEARALLAGRLDLCVLVVLAVALGYELVLALTVPPNNWASPPPTPPSIPKRPSTMRPAHAGTYCRS